MRILVALALPLLAACASPAPREEPASAAPPASAPSTAPAPGTSPTPSAGAGQVTLDFRPGTATNGGGEQKASAQGAAGAIEITGTMDTPNPCYRVSGELSGQDSRELRVRVVGRADPERTCIQSIGAVPYAATVRGLAPGTYSLTVVHAYPDAGWDEATVVQSQVVVR